MLTVKGRSLELTFSFLFLACVSALWSVNSLFSNIPVTVVLYPWRRQEIPLSLNPDWKELIVSSLLRASATIVLTRPDVMMTCPVSSDISSGQTGGSSEETDRKGFSGQPSWSEAVWCWTHKQLFILTLFTSTHKLANSSFKYSNYYFVEVAGAPTEFYIFSLKKTFLWIT